jgi:hypothetical protein
LLVANQLGLPRHLALKLFDFFNDDPFHARLSQGCELRKDTIDFFKEYVADLSRKELERRHYHQVHKFTHLQWSHWHKGEHHEC